MLSLILILISSFLFFLQKWNLSLSSSIVMITMMSKLNFQDFSVTSSNLGGDLSSTSLISLTLWIITLMILSSPEIKLKSYFFILSSSNLSLYLSFNSLNLLNFYISFEVVLIPMFLLILKLGYQKERLESAMYMLFYTIFGSFPLLYSLLKLENSLFSLNLPTLTLLYSSLKFYPSLLLLTAFLIKLPSFGFHLWLPKAHVEAPVSGSMILAAILLKLGSYGLIRSLLLIKPTLLSQSFLWTMGIWGSILSSLSCLRQADLKKTIAYSSVAHLGISMTSLFTLSTWSPIGVMTTSIAHGFCSSALFVLVNSSYQRLNSRSLLLSKGFLNTLPFFSSWMFFFLMINSSTPPSLNFWGEIFSLSSILSWNPLMTFIVIPTLFLPVFYNMVIYTTINHNYPNHKVLPPLKVQEISLLFLHIMPSLILVFKMDLNNLFYFNTAKT